MTRRLRGQRNTRNTRNEQEFVAPIPQSTTALQVVAQNTAALQKQAEQSAMKGLKALQKQSATFDKKKQDFSGQAEQFEFAVKGKNVGSLRLPIIEDTPFGKSLSKSKPFGFTDHAFGQMLGRFSSVFFPNGGTMDSADWRRIQQMFPKQFAEMGNELLDAYSKRQGSRETTSLYARVYDGDIRALFTSKYAAVDNTDMLNALLQIIEPSFEKMPGMRLVHSTVTPHALNVQVVFRKVTPNESGYKDLPDGRNGYGIGIAIRNNEIGQGGIEVLPMLWRTSCLNSMTIRDDDRARFVRHVGNKLGVMTLLKASMTEILQISGEMLELFFQSEYDALPDLADIVHGMSKAYGWKEPFKNAVLIGTEGRSTRAGLINGVSYAAHAASESLEEQQNASDLAGAILVSPQSIFGKARTAARVTNR